MMTRVTRALRAWRHKSQTAAQLYSLSDAQLRDIGLTRSDIPRVINGGNFAH